MLFFNFKLSFDILSVSLFQLLRATFTFPLLLCVSYREQNAVERSYLLDLVVSGYQQVTTMFNFLCLPYHVDRKTRASAYIGYRLSKQKPQKNNQRIECPTNLMFKLQILANPLSNCLEQSRFKRKSAVNTCTALVPA